MEMNKKTGFYVVIVSLLMLFLLSGCTQNAGVDETAQKNTEADNSDIAVQERTTTNIVTGWSINSDESLAVDEAVNKIKNKGMSSPDFVVLFSTSGYDQKTLVTELSGLLGDAKIFGLTSKSIVFTEDGLHKGEKASLAIMGFHADDLVVGVDAVHIPDKESARILAVKSVENAVKNSGKKVTDMPSLVLLSNVGGMEEIFIDAVQSVFGRNVQIVGGTTNLDDWSNGYAIANDNVVEPDAFGIAVLYYDKPIGSALHAGFIGKEKTGIATSVSNTNPRELITIDNKPAFDVYNEWADGYYDNLNYSETIEIWKTSNAMPLSRDVVLEDGSIQYVVSIPLKVNPDKSMFMGTNIYKGEKISLVTGDKNILIERAGYVAKKAMVNGAIVKSDVAGGIQMYCVGAGFVGLGEENLPAMHKSIQGVMEGKPFIGGFTGGEQGTIQGIGSFHGNFMSSMVVFSK